MNNQECPDFIVDAWAEGTPQLAEIRNFERRTNDRGICSIQILHELNPHNLHEIPPCRFACRAVALERLN